MNKMVATHARNRVCKTCVWDQGIYPHQPDWPWLMRTYGRDDLIPSLSEYPISRDPLPGEDYAPDPDFDEFENDVPLDYSDRVCRCLLMEGGDMTTTAISLRGKLAYISTPIYSRPIDDTCQRVNTWNRMEMAASAWVRFAADLGLSAVSPVVNAAAAHRAGPRNPSEPFSEEFWRLWCLPIMQNSHAVLVPRMRGWDQSLFVWRDVTWALSHGLPVRVFCDFNVGQEGLACR